MKKLYLIIAVVLASLAALSVGILSVAAHDPAEDRAKFEVTITNLTKGQIFSPAVVATHNREFSPLFELGSAASSELAMVAEDAVNGPLVAALEDDSNVKDVQVTPGPIMPGTRDHSFYSSQPLRTRSLLALSGLVSPERPLH